MHNPKAKLKTLYVMSILQSGTDAEHGLSLREIIKELGDYGIMRTKATIMRVSGASAEI